MRLFRFLLPLLLTAALLSSCDKSLVVNEEWQDITVVYGLLDTMDDTTYIKVTKAFLGEGNALIYSAIPDSSNYPHILEVRIDEFSGEQLLRSIPCDTVTIRNKQAGDSVFYYPDQLMYFTTAKLNPALLYKLYIRNKITGKEVTAQTILLDDFTVDFPQVTVSYPADRSFRVKWQQTKNGKRYQLLIRFHYTETLKADPSVTQKKYFDWLLFNYIEPVDYNSTQPQPIDLYFPGEAFYTAVGANIPVNSAVSRTAKFCDYIFTVAAPDFDTYLDVTAPSLSLVQEKPAYTNIVNGIGLFSARINKTVDSLFFSDLTLKELKVNTHTKDLGF